MKLKSPVLFAFLGALYFTLLFDKQVIGLNLLLFELPVLALFAFTHRHLFSNRIFWLLWGGSLLSAILVVINNTELSITVNFIYVFVLTGYLIYPATRSLFSSFQFAWFNVAGAPMEFLERFKTTKVRGFSLSIILRTLKIILLPVFIILVFVILYRLSNPVFDELLTRISQRIVEYIRMVFEHINWVTVGVFCIGLLVSIFLLFKYISKKIRTYEERATDELTRQKSGNRHFGTVSLKNEYKAALFLLATLNAVLLVVNVIDVKSVWFSVEWIGSYAKVKQFVHHGTYLLIISILLAAGVILFFFRGNLNFYNSKLLRYMSIAWMLQNVLLAVSVCIRNVHYVNHYALAYKRIAVFAFLILIVVGVATVIWKVMHRKTFYWVLRINSLSLLIVLLSGTPVDWSKVIARYNLRHYQKSFVQFGYLARLPDRCLPILDKTPAELAEINQHQDTLFGSSRLYLRPEQYHRTISNRKGSFISRWEQQSILSWNLANQRAYETLTGDSAYLRTAPVTDTLPAPTTSDTTIDEAAVTPRFLQLVQHIDSAGYIWDTVRFKTTYAGWLFPGAVVTEHNYCFYEMPLEKTDPYKNAVECEKGTSAHMKQWCLEWGMDKSLFEPIEKVTFYHYKAKTPSHGTTLDGIIDEWKFADSPSAQVFTEALEKRAAMVYANRGAYVCSVDNYVYTFHSRSAGFYNPLLEFFTQFVKENNAFAPNQKGQRDSY